MKAIVVFSLRKGIFVVLNHFQIAREIYQKSKNPEFSNSYCFVREKIAFGFSIKIIFLMAFFNLHMYILVPKIHLEEIKPANFVKKIGICRFRIRENM